MPNGNAAVNQNAMPPRLHCYGAKRNAAKTALLQPKRSAAKTALLRLAGHPLKAGKSPRWSYQQGCQLGQPSNISRGAGPDRNLLVDSFEFMTT